MNTRRTDVKRQHLHSIAVLLLISVLTLGFGFQSQAMAPGSDGKKVTIKVAFYQLDGFFEYDENGNPSGYGVDYLNELKKYANIEWEYVPADSWEGIKQMMIDGKVDVRMPTSEPNQPSENYDYTVEPILSTYHAILTKKSREDLYYHDYDAIAKMTIAITDTLEEKTGVMDYLESIGVKPHLVYFEDYNSCRAALDSGEVDGVITNVMDLTDDLKILDKFCVVDNYITTWKGNACYPLINNAITQMKLENPSFQSALYEQYFPERATEPFTREESAFIASKDHLTVAVYPDRRPVSYYDEATQTYQGIAIDAANLISEKIGIPFQYISVDTPDQYGMLERADLVMPVTNNPDVEKYFVSTSFLNPEVIMAVRTGEEQLQDGATIGVLSTTPGILKNIEELHRFQIVTYDTNIQALSALQKGKIQAFANSSYVINWQLENPRYDDLSSLHYQKFPLLYDIAGNVDDMVLQSILNKGIHAIGSDEFDKIVQSDSTFSMADLTSGDKLYLYRQQILIAAIGLLLLGVAAAFYNHSRTIYIEKIRESSRLQEKANRAKSEFLARMSHDMRTPLNVIIGMEQLARDNDNPDDTNDCLDKINVASEFLLGLINDVLDMEHIESGKMELHLMPYTGEEFTQYIHSVITPLCEQKNIRFEYIYEGASQFTIMQDKLRVNQVYFNILSNAVKYTHEGGQIRFCTKSSVTENHRIRLEVHISDTGIGMSEEFQKHMFEPFSQENQVMKPVGEGTGLGLSIVKKICDMLHMTISVKSELGKGTEYTLCGEYDIAEESDRKEIQNTSADHETKDPDSLQNKTILVCEDHPLNQEIIRRILEKKGAVVVMAENGKRGVEAFERSIPGNIKAILMDIRMPVMDGIQATREIRNMDRADGKTVPIIALTANAYEEDVKNCLEAGMNSHLSKPVEPAVLYETLEKYIK